MPISSTEIAALNGGYEGMRMNQMAYANMIGQPPGSYGGSGPDMSSIGERTMGHAMNRGAAIGAPLLMGAMGLAGIDPLSMGLKAGIGAFQGGAGIGGALGAGALTAAPLAMGMAAAGYAGNQMMTGAQQQMALNNSLRSSFSFQNRQGGQGFTQSDMGQIGGVLRSMTEQFGPGGEITGFRELTQLSQKMGGMGLAQGVRDVQEFSKRFKEMVTHLKTMAKDLGTTLEGAMEFASAARGSGVFGMGNASKFATMARQASVSGGLAMSEVTGAASIGSQISRSIGGTGSQGAMAGMRTISQIGTAVQMGVLSEQDIYNVTGLTGAEGKQAYATSQMQRTASFLQSGRGRRMIASLTDKDGKLNEANVQELLSGGMGIEQTVAHTEEMKKNIGRFNFVRNEGRGRGAVMARLGGTAPTLQMLQWLKSKNIDVDNMDDRSMLIAQKQLGMGRDELETTLQEVRNLPAITRQQRFSEEKDAFSQDYAQRRKGMGIEGIKNRFAQAAETINGKLEKVGQDIFNQGSEKLERFFNSLTQQYIETMSEATDDAFHAAMKGGALGDVAAAKFTGGGIPKGLQGFSRSLTNPVAQNSVEAFNAGGQKDSWMSYVTGESSRSKYEAAGFGKMVATTDPVQLRKNLAEIDQMQLAANAPPSADLLALGKDNAPWLNKEYATSLMGIGGTDRVDKLGEQIMLRGKNADPRSPEGRLAQRWSSAKTPTERTLIAAGLEPGANIDPAARLKANFIAPTTSAFSQGYKTLGERHQAFAAAVLGEDSSQSAGGMWAGALAGGTSGALVGAGVGAIFGGVGALPGAAVGWGVGTLLGAAAGMNLFHGESGMREALGEKLGSDAYQGLVGNVFGGDPEARERAIQTAHTELQKLTNAGTGDKAQADQYAYESLLATSDLQNGVDPKKVLSTYSSLARHGVTTEAHLRYVAGGQAAIAEKAWNENNIGEGKLRRSIGAKERSLIETGGAAIFKGETVELTAAGKDALKGIKGGEELITAAFAATALDASVDISTGKSAGAGLSAAAAKYREFDKRLGTMSVEDKRTIAARYAGTAAGAMVSESATTESHILNAKRRGAGGGTQAAAGLGFHLSREEQRVMDGSGTSQEKEDILLKHLNVGAGVATPELRGQLKQLMDATTGVKGVGLGHSIAASTGAAAGLAGGIQGDTQVSGAKVAAKAKSDAERDPFGKTTVDLLTKLPGDIAAALSTIQLHTTLDKPAEAPVYRKPAQPGGVAQTDPHG